MKQPSAQLVFQRWLEFEPPPGVGREPPMWTWPVALGDGRTILTLLYRPLVSPAAARQPPQTVILEVSAVGDAAVWAPGQGYPAPVIFYASAGDDLFGLDLTMPGKVYACRPDGAHLATLPLAPRMGSLIAPQTFFQRGEELFWLDTRGRAMRGLLRSGVLVEDHEVESLPPGDGDVRFPHTHLTRGSLFVLDFDPIARISRYVLGA